MIHRWYTRESLIKMWSWNDSKQNQSECHCSLESNQGSHTFNSRVANYWVGFSLKWLSSTCSTKWGKKNRIQSQKWQRERGPEINNLYWQHDFGALQWIIILNDNMILSNADCSKMQHMNAYIRKLSTTTIGEDRLRNSKIVQARTLSATCVCAPLTIDNHVQQSN